MYLSISSWSEPALATLARVGVPLVGDAVGLDETALLDPQPTATNPTSAMGATANLERKTRTDSTSARPLIDDRH
jgi:hypothetical protein